MGPVIDAKAPRLYLHPDGKVISIGFDGTQDTLLTLEIGAARYSESDRDHGDMKVLADWVKAVSERLMEPSLNLKGTSVRRPYRVDSPAGTGWDPLR